MRTTWRDSRSLAGLGRGEAAALAIALKREYDFATDDQDAIRVAGALEPSKRTYRIRALLMHAADVGLITRQEAGKFTPRWSVLASGIAGRSAECQAPPLGAAWTPDARRDGGCVR